MRAVIDVNVLISSTLSARGSSARLVREWRDGAFELIVSPLLLDELQRAFNYPKLRERVTAQESHQFVRQLRDQATFLADPDSPPPVRSPDLDDDYLLALAAETRAVLVTHDQDLLAPKDNCPVRAPDEFLRQLDDAEPNKEKPADV